MKQRRFITPFDYRVLLAIAITATPAKPVSFAPKPVDGLGRVLPGAKSCPQPSFPSHHRRSRESGNPGWRALELTAVVLCYQHVPL